MIELIVRGSAQAALVDDGFSYLARYKWKLDKDGYAVRSIHGKRVHLHHVVLPGKRYPAFVRDHINRDKLDNRKANLRWVPRSANAQNRGAASKNALGLRGVMPTGYGTYRATARVDGVIHRFGVFDDPYQAHAVLSAWRAQHMPFAVER